MDRARPERRDELELEQWRGALERRTDSRHGRGRSPEEHELNPTGAMAETGVLGNPWKELVPSHSRRARALASWAALTALAMLVCACSSGCRRAASSSPPKKKGLRPVWQEAVLVATGPAHRGPWQMNDSDFRWVDDPSVDVDPTGRIAVTCVDQSRKDVFFRRYEPTGKAEIAMPANVSMSPETFSWLPRVELAPGNPERVHVLWQEIVFTGGSHGGEIFFARSLDGGRTFGPPLNLSNTTAGDGKGRLDAETWDNGSLDLTHGPKGEIYAAWTEYEGPLWFRRSLDDGASFEDAVRVGDDAHARGPSLAIGQSGEIHIAWAVGDDPSADVRFATATEPSHGFGPALRVGPSDGHSDAPQLVVDHEGTVHLVYAERPPAAPSYHVRYTRLRRGATDFEAPRRISAPLDGGSDQEGAHYPDIAVDGEGRIYVLWERYLDEAGRPRGLAFTFSADRGDHFASPSPIPESVSEGFNGSQQGLLLRKLSVDERGHIAIVNSTFQPNEASRVWLVRGQLEKR